MTLKDKKAYDLLVLKLEHIYGGATGSGVCKIDEELNLSKADAARVSSAIYMLIGNQFEDTAYDLQTEFTTEFDNLDSEIEDIEVVADWLFQKGVR